jgi:hypothetical protein
MDRSLFSFVLVLNGFDRYSPLFNVDAVPIAFSSVVFTGLTPVATSRTQHVLQKSMQQPIPPRKLPLSNPRSFPPSTSRVASPSLSLCTEYKQKQ